MLSQEVFKRQENLEKFSDRWATELGLIDIHMVIMKEMKLRASTLLNWKSATCVSRSCQQNSSAYIDASEATFNIRSQPNGLKYNMHYGPFITMHWLATNFFQFLYIFREDSVVTPTTKELNCRYLPHPVRPARPQQRTSHLKQDIFLQLLFRRLRLLLMSNNNVGSERRPSTTN
jgi:hypothetical protein